MNAEKLNTVAHRNPLVLATGMKSTRVQGKDVWLFLVKYKSILFKLIKSADDFFQFINAMTQNSRVVGIS